MFLDCMFNFSFKSYHSNMMITHDLANSLDPAPVFLLVSTDKYFI